MIRLKAEEVFGHFSIFTPLYLSSPSLFTFLLSPSHPVSPSLLSRLKTTKICEQLRVQIFGFKNKLASRQNSCRKNQTVLSYFAKCRSCFFSIFSSFLYRYFITKPIDPNLRSNCYLLNPSVVGQLKVQREGVAFCSFLAI